MAKDKKFQQKWLFYPTIAKCSQTGIWCLTYIDGFVLLYVREDIPSNLITVNISPIESFYVELNLRNNNWLIDFSYNYQTLDWYRKWLVDFNAGKTKLVLFDQSINAGATDVKMGGSVLEEKSSFKMLGFNFSSKLKLGTYNRYILLKCLYRVVTCSLEFLFPQVSQYLYKSTMQSSMEYCCHVEASAPSCYL